MSRNPLTDEQVRRFDRDGFLNGGPILSSEAVDELVAELHRVIGIGPDGFGEDDPQPVLFRNMRASQPEQQPVWQIVNIWETSSAFERLLYHPFVVGAIAQLTGQGDLQVWHDQVQYKPAHEGGSTPWHQDAPLWPSIEPDTPVSAWIPLEDADLENGCMWMVPGSHKWGVQSEYLGSVKHLSSPGHFGDLTDFTPPADAEVQKVEAVPRPVKRGEVHFHHSLTWHGSPDNASDRPRRAIAIHYMTGEAKFTGRDHPMRRFIEVDVGERMRHAGPHFPVVCEGGEPVAAPDRVPAGSR